MKRRDAVDTTTPARARQAAHNWRMAALVADTTERARARTFAREGAALLADVPRDVVLEAFRLDPELLDLDAEAPDLLAQLLDSKRTRSRRLEEEARARHEEVTRG